MTEIYARMGVNVPEADRGIERIVQRIKRTWPTDGFGKVQMDIGYFANVIDIGNGIGLASTTDGVGSKTIIADLMQKWDTIGIDCVAMNVNDLICVGARPTSMLDYIGVGEAEAHMLDQIAMGLTEGAIEAGISITGGEVSQLPDNIRGFDLVGSAFGFVPLDQIIDGSAVQPDDYIIGIESSGIHSNGLTMARRILIEEAFLDWTTPWDELGGRSIGEELLHPTSIYVKEVLELIEKVNVHALVNITGDGLLNLNRVNAPDVGFLLGSLPLANPIFSMIAFFGKLSAADMYQTFNMGVGFCVIVPPEHVNEALEIIHSHGKHAQVIGSVTKDPDRAVRLLQHQLVGHGKRFRSA